MYSALTLAMLLLFEGVLAQQRLMSLQMLRSMRKDPFFLYAYRAGKWELLQSDQLVPGDIVSLASAALAQKGPKGSLQHHSISSLFTTVPGRKQLSQLERYVPCDAVIIRGSCVVNEAMLTGERTPSTFAT
jgi:manganese-transporting P-type ATPase